MSALIERCIHAFLFLCSQRYADTHQRRSLPRSSIPRSGIISGPSAKNRNFSRPGSFGDSRCSVPTKRWSKTTTPPAMQFSGWRSSCLRGDPARLDRTANSSAAGPWETRRRLDAWHTGCPGRRPLLTQSYYTPHFCCVRLKRISGTAK